MIARFDVKAPGSVRAEVGSTEDGRYIGVRGGVRSMWRGCIVTPPPVI